MSNNWTEKIPYLHMEELLGIQTLLQNGICKWNSKMTASEMDRKAEVNSEKKKGN